MSRIALPEGSHPAFRLRIGKEPYEAALQLFREQRFAESLAAIQNAVAQSGADTETAPGPTVRDGALLAAENLHRLRRYDECRQWLDQAASEGLLPEDDPEADLIEFWIKWAEGEYDEVVSVTGQFVEQHRGDLHPLLGEYLFVRGNALSRLGRPEEALEDCTTAHAFFRVQKRREQQAEACNVIGRIQLEQARYGAALRWFNESLEINQALQLTHRIGDNCLNIGIAYYKEGDFAEAHGFLSRAYEISETLDVPHVLCRARIALGNVFRLQGDCTSARANLLAAYTLATERRLAREECLALEFLGDIFRDEGKPEEARRYYARGLTIARNIAPGGDLVGELMRRDGECLDLMDQPEAALAALRKARALSAQLGDRFEEGVTLRCLASVATRLKRWDVARQYVAAALAHLEAIEARYEEAEAHLCGAAICLAQIEVQGADQVPASLYETALQHAMTADRRFQGLQLVEHSARARETFTRLAAHQWGPAASGGRISRAPFVPESLDESGVVAISAAMRAALQQSEVYARFDEAVLITGETGTGKDLIARRIHDLSPRRNKPFVAVNCAAIPATLFEREFFGNRRGAYSGADSDTPGFVAQAEGGTLFLDEIGEMPWELQAKLLRLLQDGSYIRLGDPQEHKADLRLIAATNSDLDQLVATGKFRQDLSYRLKALEITLAPLRDRPEDILPLLKHFLSRFCDRPVLVQEYFDESSLRALRRHTWPGNVRELIMVARRAQISKETTGRTDVQMGIGKETRRLTSHGSAGQSSEITRDRLLHALRSTSGNKAKTARQLGVARQTLYRWMKRHGISD